MAGCKACGVLAVFLAVACMPVGGIGGDGTEGGGGEATSTTPTLMLNMLVKNEERHLERTLPKWAKLVDYWIIGIDNDNEDGSEQVIKRHLGHLPGSTVRVSFDGMGPTWTLVVQRGRELYPEATHGILSDADFTPLISSFDRTELDLNCSKHTFDVISSDATDRRHMDWIYRNIEGARVERRTHQVVQVPPIPGQKHYLKRLTSFRVQEHEGGYQDRLPPRTKHHRYIKLLEADLKDMPGDSRTLYYLGQEHLELVGDQAKRDLRRQGERSSVVKALRYYRARALLPPPGVAQRRSVDEERYWAYLKSAEICERYIQDFDCARNMWLKALRMDPARADASFYLGQHYRLIKRPRQAIQWLTLASSLKMPSRFYHQWPELYSCLRHSELLNAIAMLPSLRPQHMQLASAAYAKASVDCSREELKPVEQMWKAVQRKQVFEGKPPIPKVRRRLM